MSLRRRYKKEESKVMDIFSFSEKMDTKMVQYTTAEKNTEIRKINSVRKEIKIEFNLKYIII